MRIGIDVDGVLAHFTRAYHKLANELFDKPKGFYEPEDWGFSNYNLSPTEVKIIWSTIKQTPGFWLSLPAYPDAFRLSGLIHPEDSVFFITSRVSPKGILPEFETAKWLRENLGISYPCVIVRDNKGEVSKALSLDTFIDDRIENCEDVRVKHPECRVFVMDRPWNQGYVGVERVSGLGEFFSASRLPR